MVTIGLERYLGREEEERRGEGGRASRRLCFSLISLKKNYNNTLHEGVDSERIALLVWRVVSLVRQSRTTLCFSWCLGAMQRRPPVYHHSGDLDRYENTFSKSPQMRFLPPPPSDRMCKKKAEGKHSHQLTPFQDGNRKEIFHLSISVRECVCESGSESEREGILTQLCLPMLFNPDRSCGLPALCLHCIVQYKCVILAWLLPPPPQGDERHNCVERQERDS